MGKTKKISQAQVPTTTTPIRTTIPTDTAPSRERQPSALSDDGDILWEDLEKELQENNLRY